MSRPMAFNAAPTSLSKEEVDIEGIEPPVPAEDACDVPVDTANKAVLETPLVVLLDAHEYILADEPPDFVQFVFECTYNSSKCNTWKAAHEAHDTPEHASARKAARRRVENSIAALTNLSKNSVIDDMASSLQDSTTIPRIFREIQTDPDAERLLKTIADPKAISNVPNMSAADIKSHIIAANKYGFTTFLDRIARLIDSNASDALIRAYQQRKRENQTTRTTFDANALIASIFCVHDPTLVTSSQYKFLLPDEDRSYDLRYRTTIKSENPTPVAAAGGGVAHQKPPPKKINLKKDIVPQLELRRKAALRIFKRKSQRGGVIDVNTFSSMTGQIMQGPVQGPSRTAWFDAPILNIMMNHLAVNSIAYILDVVPANDPFSISTINNPVFVKLLDDIKKDMTPTVNTVTNEVSPPRRFWRILTTNDDLNVLPSLANYAPDGASMQIHGGLFARFKKMHFSGNLHLFGDRNNHPTIVCDKVCFSYDKSKEVTLDGLYVNGTVQFNTIFYNKQFDMRTLTDRSSMRARHIAGFYTENAEHWPRQCDVDSRLTVQHCHIGKKLDHFDDTLPSQTDNLYGLRDVRALLSFNLAFLLFNTDTRTRNGNELPPIDIPPQNIRNTPINYNPVIYKRAFVLNNTLQCNPNADDEVCVRSGNGPSTLVVHGNKMVGLYNVVKYVCYDSNELESERATFTFTNNEARNTVCGIVIVLKRAPFDDNTGTSLAGAETRGTCYYLPQYSVLNNTFTGRAVQGINGLKSNMVLPKPNIEFEKENGNNSTPYPHSMPMLVILNPIPS